MNEVTIEQILTLHKKSIYKYGGSEQILDRTKIESAINFIHLDLYTIPEVAGILTYRLVKNHPFSDGNKRTALLTAMLFLKMNNFKYTGRSKDIEYLIMDIANSKISKEDAMAHFFHNTIRI